MHLKDTLLSLNIVNDNEWLDKYCLLIENNYKTKKEKNFKHIKNKKKNAIKKGD